MFSKKTYCFRLLAIKQKNLLVLEAGPNVDCAHVVLTVAKPLCVFEHLAHNLGFKLKETFDPLTHSLPLCNSYTFLF